MVNHREVSVCTLSQVSMHVHIQICIHTLTQLGCCNRHKLVTSTGLTGVKLPPNMRKCGRPKGAEKTIIGMVFQGKRNERINLYHFSNDREKGPFSIDRKSGTPLIMYIILPITIIMLWFSVDSEVACRVSASREAHRRARS